MKGKKSMQMNYTSTRDSGVHVSASEAIVRGLAPDGGLFVPETLPQCAAGDFYGLTYAQTAQKILGLFLTDFDAAFLHAAAEASYSEANFAGKAGHLEQVAEGLFSLELWHGPTCAFKDYALQIMPRLLVEAKKNIGDTSLTKILVATSGDTGKAALAGYSGVEGVKIAVFYPESGTSAVQRLQMATQQGENVQVYAVRGNFDDAQTGVKRVFADTGLAEALAQKNERLSSANSINWGRLAPQIVYYFYSYAQLVRTGKIVDGQRVNFCVPTGNFGDILAGWYAKQMGLPVDKLICASNKNDVLAEFLATGTYNANRTFYKTTSPSMDILVSSNLERLLYHVTGEAKTVRMWMQALSAQGSYTVPAEVLACIQAVFACGSADDDAVAAQIAQEYVEHGYLCDTHTAVAFLVAQLQADAQLMKEETSPYVILSTASPYKFAGDVLHALGGAAQQDEFAAMAALHAKTGSPIPQTLAQLRGMPVRFDAVLTPQEIGRAALEL